MTRYSGLCIGGPLNGQNLVHDRHHYRAYRPPKFEVSTSYLSEVPQNVTVDIFDYKFIPGFRFKREGSREWEEPKKLDYWVINTGEYPTAWEVLSELHRVFTHSARLHSEQGQKEQEDLEWKAKMWDKHCEMERKKRGFLMEMRPAHEAADLPG